MPRLTKEEVDTYINKYYGALYTHAIPYCVKCQLNPREVINEWYMALLKTEQKAEKHFILSRTGLYFFMIGRYKQLVGYNTRNIRKLPHTLFADFYGEFNNIVDEAKPTPEDIIIQKSEIVDLHNKVNNITRNKWYKSRNQFVVVKDKSVLKTFNEILKEDYKGTRQAVNQRRKTLIKRLRKAYGIQDDGKTPHFVGFVG